MTKIKLLYPDSICPKRSKPNDSGRDLHAHSVEVWKNRELWFRNDLDNAFILYPKCSCLVRTGVSIAVPDGNEGQIRSRSGIALKDTVFVLNSPATIDISYRGEIMVVLANIGDSSFSISKGDRIAQYVVTPVVIDDEEIVDDLDETDRGVAGFGSTGVSHVR